jgi:hypothetical protein
VMVVKPKVEISNVPEQLPYKSPTATQRFRALSNSIDDSPTTIDRHGPGHGPVQRVSRMMCYTCRFCCHRYNVRILPMGLVV